MDTDVCIYVVLVLCIIGYIVYVAQSDESTKPSSDFDSETRERFEDATTSPATTDKDSMSLYRRIVNSFENVLDRFPTSEELYSYVGLFRAQPEYSETKLKQQLMATPEYKSTQSMQKNTVGDIAGVINEEQIRQTIISMYQRVWNQAPSDATYSYLRETYVSQLNLNPTQLEAYIRQLKAPSRNAAATPSFTLTIDPASHDLYISIMGEPPLSDLEPSIQRTQTLLTQSKTPDMAQEYLWQLRGVRDGITTTKAEDRRAILDANAVILAQIRQWEQVMTERAPISLYRLYGDIYRNQIKRDTLKIIALAIQSADKRAQTVARVRGSAPATIDAISGWYRTAQRTSPYQLPTASFIAFVVDRASLKGWSDPQAQTFIQNVFVIIREQADKLTDYSNEGKPASITSKKTPTDPYKASVTRTKDGVTLVIQRPQIYNIYGASSDGPGEPHPDGPMGTLLSDPQSVLDAIRQSQKNGTLDKNSAARILDSRTQMAEGPQVRLASAQTRRNVDELRYACERNGTCSSEDAIDDNSGSRFWNADDWGKLRPEFEWMVPQTRAPVCTTAPAPPPASLYDQSALLGTPLEDARRTQVGSIMPAFQFKELPRGKAPAPAPREANVPYEPATRPSR